MITSYRDHVGWVNLVAGPTLLAARDLDGNWLVCGGAGGRRLDDLVRACAEADQKYPLRLKVKRVDVEHHNGWWYAKVRDGFVDMFQRRPSISDLAEIHPSYDWSEAYCIIHDVPPAPAKQKVESDAGKMRWVANPPRPDSGWGRDWSIARKMWERP